MTVKEFAQTYLAVGFAGFKEAHGTHLEPSKTTGTGMKNLAPIRRNGGTRENKLPHGSTMINFKAGRIPEFRGNLPFVDQSGCFSP